MTRRKRQRRAGRRKPFRDPKPRLLVVCEGQNTEPQYLNGYVHHLKNPSYVLEVEAGAGDPRKIVEVAKQRCNEAQPGDFDACWCVFDRDEHTRFADAVDMARANGLELAVSNPCFELWLLLHFRESPGLQDRHTVQKMLGDHVDGYDKRVEFAQFASGVEEAEKRATRLDTSAEEMGEAGRNPTTQVYRLTRAIRGEPGGGA